MPKVLVVGGGSREHALAAAVAEEGHEVLVLPGNAGTSIVGKNLVGKADDLSSIVAACAIERPDLVVVGPEQPLVDGLADLLREKGHVVFGPSKSAARLEGSKAFMKHFLKRHGIATAAFEVFDDADRAEAFVRSANRPLVVKADGLAAGKGVVVATTTDEALKAIQSMMRDRVFGPAGDVVVIEEVLAGEEASFHVLCDGTRAVPLVAAQDHKRVHDGDRGPNTGGMGAYAPAPIVTADVQAKVMARVVEPTLVGMAAEGNPFVGVLFVGLMIDRGEPCVLEFNVRFGDPETVVLLPLYRGHVYALLHGAAVGSLPDAPKPNGHAMCVVMAAEGYPAVPTKGDIIGGLDTPLVEGQFVRHAGTTTKDGHVVTQGGRVLAVGARADSLQHARDLAYAAVDRIHWRGEHHRTDIGHRALKRRATSP
jgi:phosphoribosylamine---glycine ligase